MVFLSASFPFSHLWWIDVEIFTFMIVCYWVFYINTHGLLLSTFSPSPYNIIGNWMFHIYIHDRLFFSVSLLQLWPFVIEFFTLTFMTLSFYSQNIIIMRLYESATGCQKFFWDKHVSAVTHKEGRWRETQKVKLCTSVLCYYKILVL